MNGKTISYSVLSIIIGSLLFLGGATLESDKVYYCENRNIVMQCDSLSAYYGLDNGKCLNSEVGNKLCKSGWLKIEKNFAQPESPQVKSKQYICNIDNCKAIN